MQGKETGGMELLILTRLVKKGINEKVTSEKRVSLGLDKYKTLGGKMFSNISLLDATISTQT